MRDESSWEIVLPEIINSGITPRAVLKACLFYMKMRKAKFTKRVAEQKAIKKGLDRLTKLDQALDYEEPE